MGPRYPPFPPQQLSTNRQEWEAGCHVSREVTPQVYPQPHNQKKAPPHRQGGWGGSRGQARVLPPLRRSL